jgi:pyocin large subunit-like protein
MAGTAMLLVAACDNGPSAVAKNGAAAPTAASTSESSSNRAASDAPRVDHRQDPVPVVDGKPMWSSSRKYSAEDAARRSFERNGEDFGVDTLDAYVRKAHAFVEHPPAGTERLKRSNGDTLFYNAGANIFAVANKAGAPRTMFKPDEGAAYWTEQKDREARRQTARQDRRSSDDG